MDLQQYRAKHKFKKRLNPEAPSSRAQVRCVLWLRSTLPLACISICDSNSTGR